MKSFTILLLLLLLTGCDEYGQDSTAVGSGAGIDEVQKQPPGEPRDMNITTPIYDEQEEKTD